MILYGQRLSPFVRKVLVYAAEKGIALDFEPAGFGVESEGFAKASPFGKIPGFADGDFHISDSSAIITYLEALHPEPALIPLLPRERARVIWYEEFGDTILFDTSRKMFFNRFVAPRMKLPFDNEEADQAECKELPPLLDYLEKIVPDAGFLVGDSLTLADISVASPLINVGYCSTVVDAATYPRLRAWLEVIWARPSFRDVVALERSRKTE